MRRKYFRPDHPRDRLTGKQLRAIDYYFGEAGRNMTQALRLAGYKQPNSQSHGFFRKPHIVAEINRRENLVMGAEDRAVKKVADKYGISYERTIREIALLAYARIGHVLDFDKDTGEFVGINLAKADEDQLASIGEITTETVVEGRGEAAQTVRRVRVKPYNKAAALDLLMRHSGMSKEKLKVEGHVSLIERIQAGRKRIKEEPADA